MSPDGHARVKRCLEEGWAALDELLDEYDEYSEGLTPEQRTTVMQCREMLSYLLLEIEDISP